MAIDDREAIALRDWAIGEQETPSGERFAQAALGQAWNDLIDYESNARNEGRVPYQLNPRIERESLDRVQRIWDGEESFSEDADEETNRQGSKIAYLAMRFQKPIEDVQSSLPSFEQAMTMLYPQKDVDSAIREDMDATRERIETIDQAYRHSYMNAFREGSEMDGFISFTQDLEEIPDGLADLYGAAHSEATKALTQNREQFERLGATIRPIVQEADVMDTRQFFEAIGQLADIAPEHRTLAMRYIEATVPGEKGIAESFLGRANEVMREIANLTPAEIHRNAMGIIEAVKAGQPIQEPIATADMPFVSEAAQAAFRVAYTEPGTRMPFYQTLPPEAAARRYQDARTAADFAETMLWMQRYSREVTGPESFADNPSFKAAYEQVVYGGSRMSADMALVLGSFAVGRKVGGIRGQEQFRKIVGMGYGLKSMIPALQAEHYDMLRAKGLDPQDAMFVSDASAPIAATLEVMGDLFVLSKLPGVSKIQKRLGAQVTSPLLAGIISGAEAVGVETATELAQDLTASMVQEMASALDESIPDANFAEDLAEAIKSAPDIALNVLPFAMVGGGHTGYITAQARESITANPDAMRFFGIPEEAITDIGAAENLQDKEAIFIQHFDIKKAVKTAMEAQEAGVQISELATEDGQSAVEVAESAQNPAKALKSEGGEVQGYEISPEQRQVEWSDLERLDIDVLDKAAWGVVQDETITVSPDELGIRYKEDLANPEAKFKEGGMDWVRSVDLSEPIEIGVSEEGNLQIEDGHHRWFAAKKLGKDITGTITIIRGKPIAKILEDQDLARSLISEEVEGMPPPGPTTVRTRTELSNVTDSPVERVVQESSEGGKTISRGDALALEGVEESPLGTNMPNPAKVSFAAVEPVSATKPVSSPQAMQAVADIMKAVGEPAVIRQGRFGRRKALGTFWVKQKLVRVATANDVPTAAHEIAHAMEDALFGTGPVWQRSKEINARAKAELNKLGKDLYGSKVPNGGYKSEGFSEFIRLRLSDPSNAEIKAPEFFKFWEKKLNSIPSLRRRFDNASDIVRRYLLQGAEARAQANIAKAETMAQKVAGKSKIAGKEFYRQFIEAGAAIERFSKEAAERKGLDALPEDADPVYTMQSRRLTADAVVDYMATKGMLDIAGNVTGTAPLAEAFELVGQKDSEKFVIYLWAKRSLALWTDPRKRNPGMDLKDAQFLVNELENPKFKKAAQIVYDWNNGILSYAAQSSEDFAETVTKIRQSDPGFYIPLFREFNTLDKAYQSIGGKASTASITKRLKGSGRRIKDPIESMLTQAKQVVLKAHQRLILEQIIRIADNTDGMGHYIFEVPKDMVPQAARSVADVIEQISGKLDPLAAVQFQAEADAMTGDIADEILTFFAPAHQASPNENPIMPVYIDGKTRWLEMDVDLYKALNGMDLYNLPKILDIFLGLPARTMRIGTTGLRASFSLVTNPLRDLRTLHLNSRAGANQARLLHTWLGSMWDSFVYTMTGGKIGTQWIDMFERMGIEMAQPLGQDTRPLKRAARRVKRGGRWSFFDPGDYYDTLIKVLQFPESASRLAEMKLYAKDLGYDPKQPLTADIAQKLAIAAKQVTTDFTQAGDVARKVNQAVPFFNAAIQGPVAHARALKRNPGKFMLRGLYGTAAVLANWMRNKDEEWWREMPLEERYIFTYIPVGDELIRIPRAFEADGIFLAGAEALIDAWYAEDPQAASEWASKWVTGFLPSPMPVLPKLALEQAANKNFFFDSPIVPRGEIMGNIPQEEQFGPYTLNTSIWLGDLFNVSPRRIDHSIRSLFGGVGVDVLSVFGRGAGVRQEDEFEPADMPVIGTIFQRGGQMARNPISIEKLYTRYGEVLERQASKRREETPEERLERLRIMDAVRALSVLRDIQYSTYDRDKRNKIEERQIKIARDALQGRLNRAQLKQLKQMAERERKAMERQ